MKNLITIVAVCFSMATGFAQDTKPTKEQTISFIINMLNGKEIYSIILPELSKSTLYPSSRQNNMVESISIDNCKLILNLKKEINESYKDIRWYEYERIIYKDEKIQIPLEKIELIKQDVLTYSDYDMSTGYILFKSAMNHKTIQSNSKEYIKNKKSKKIDHESIEEKDLSDYILDLNTFDTQQLVKAFNHLRKLCNAPEPISFD